MKKFCYVVVVAAVLFAAKSCKPEEEEVDPIPVEDTSGFCTVIFQNMEYDLYTVFIDNKPVKEYMQGYTAFTVSGVQAGTRTLEAVQQSGYYPPQSPKTVKNVVKILTDSVYTWEFP